MQFQFMLMRVLWVIFDHRDCRLISSIQRHLHCSFCRRHWRCRRSCVAQTASGRPKQEQRSALAFLVVHRETERLLVIVTLQGVPIVVFAKQRLERIGKQHEVRDVRCAVTLCRNAPFRIICRNPSCTMPFRDNGTLPVSTCQSNSTWILLPAPLETPKNGLVICGGRLRPPIQMSFVSIRS